MVPKSSRNSYYAHVPIQVKSNAARWHSIYHLQEYVLFAFGERFWELCLIDVTISRWALVKNSEYVSSSGLNLEKVLQKHRVLQQAFVDNINFSQQLFKKISGTLSKQNKKIVKQWSLQRTAMMRHKLLQENWQDCCNIFVALPYKGYV